MSDYSPDYDNLFLNILSSKEIETIKKKISNHDKNIEVVFSYLDELVEKKGKPNPRIRIGYMPDEL